MPARCCSAARELLVAAGNASYSDTERGEHRRRAAVAARAAASPSPTRATAPARYLFGGQGATQKPFVDAPGGVQFVAPPAADARPRAGTALPLTTDGRLAWLPARTGNGVFVTSAGAGVPTRRSTAASVTDPSALTGSDYTLQFSVGGGVTTYAVLKNGAADRGDRGALRLGPGDRGRRHDASRQRHARQRRPVPDRAVDADARASSASLDQAIAGLQTTGRTGSQIAQANADSLRDIDSVMGTLQSARARSPAQVLNRIDSETDRLDDQKLASQTRAIERRRCGHGARDLRLPEQAKRLRCGAQVVRDGAAPVVVPVRQRRMTQRAAASPQGADLLDVAILGQVALGYSPFIDRNRTVAATRLTVYPAAPRRDARRRPAAARGRRRLAGERRQRLAQRRQREPRSTTCCRRSPSANLMVEVPDFMASDPANVDVADAPARRRQHAAAQGPPERRAAARRCCPASSTRSSTSPTSAASARARSRRAGVTRSIAHVQSGVRTVADMEAAFARGAHAVLGWPIDDAHQRHRGAHRQAGGAARPAGDRRADPSGRQRGADRASSRTR